MMPARRPTVAKCAQTHSHSTTGIQNVYRLDDLNIIFRFQQRTDVSEKKRPAEKSQPHKHIYENVNACSCARADNQITLKIPRRKDAKQHKRSTNEKKKQKKMK